MFAVNKHDRESGRQILNENVSSSTLPKRRSLVGTYTNVLENLIPEVSEMKGQIQG